jgi:methyl-accepting chemotaxis protein
MAFDTVPETGWVVCMSAYQDDLLSTAREQRIVLGIMAVVLILLLVGMIIVVTRRFIITPLLNIEHFTHAVAQGDFGAALEGSFQCELGDLKDNVGHMVAEIKSKLGFSQGILDGLTLPCAVVDMEQRVTFANQALLGFMEREGSVDECRGLLFADLLYREEREQSLLAEAMRDGKAIVGVEREYRTYRKNLRHVSIDTAPLYDLDGHMLGAFVLFSDLTSIREQGRAMQRQNERINETAQQADTIAKRLAAASEELSAQVAEAAQGADVQRERTTETATAMEEMNATVLEVARNASSAAENADRARSTAENGLSVMEELLLAIRTVNANAGELRASMEGLGEQAQAIGSVMNVINDIADQTNLLALNAAIEAARAGEAGRGFAVVADEVRKLAEKTMAATREVGSAIQAIQDGAQGNVRATETAVESVNRSTELAEQSGKALEEIVAMVEQTADQVRSIATASEEQSATSEEINTATEEINRISAETSDTMQQSTRAIQELAELAGNLERLMAGMCAGDDCGDTGKTGGNGASRGDSGHAAADVAEED